MNTKDTLGDRMKNYENVSRNYLIKRTPVIIRIDGKAFHTFTKGFDRPFDSLFMESMQETMQYLCKNIQGCVFGYTQSDEITLVLTDYTNIDTCAWFDNNIQKIASVSASMATLAFNRIFSDKVSELDRMLKPTDKYEKALTNGALFDSRCFNLPKEEVVNCLIWRQNDALRNSVLSVGQHFISFTCMQGLKINQIADQLLISYDVDFEDYSTAEKRGSCCIKQLVPVETKFPDGSVEVVNRSKWIIDREIPIFANNKDYIEKYL